MSVIASQITSLTIVYSTVYPGVDQSKHQSSASLAFVWGIHRRPVNSPHKWPVTRKIFPFDDVIMKYWYKMKFSEKKTHGCHFVISAMPADGFNTMKCQDICRYSDDPAWVMYTSGLNLEGLALSYKARSDCRWAFNVLANAWVPETTGFETWPRRKKTASLLSIQNILPLPHVCTI